MVSGTAEFGKSEIARSVNWPRPNLQNINTPRARCKIRGMVASTNPPKSPMMESGEQAQIDVLLGRVRLPCGLELSNRLVKAAMEPCLAKAARPSQQHLFLHSRWSEGSFGFLISENVQVSQRHLATPYDLALHPDDAEHVPRTWTAWAAASKTPTLIQLSHPGLQSSRGSGRPIWECSIAPSATRLSLGTRLIDRLVSWALFNTAREASKNDIKLLVLQFSSAAVVAYKAGFQGVQLHCSHGYLLAQFMSPKTNLRSDEYGQTPSNRLRFLFEIIDAIRSSVPKSFCVAIKLNSSDFVQGGLTEDDALNNVEMIVKHGGVDLIEISGGTYENVAMLREDISHQGKHPLSQVNAREAFFLEFAGRARRLIQHVSAECGQPSPLLLTTGGFRTRRGMARAIASRETDLVGIGRPACLDPLVARKILDPTLAHYVCPTALVPGVKMWEMLLPVRLIGAGFNTIWHTWQLQKIANNVPVDLSCTAFGALRAIIPLDAILASLALAVLILGAVFVNKIGI